MKDLATLADELREALKGVTPQEFMMYPKLLDLASAVDFLMDIK